MRTVQKKDKSIELWVETDKQFYFSGEAVKGNICLDVKNQRRPYCSLWVLLKAEEKIIIKQNQQEINKQSYKNNFKIKQFEGDAIQVGQYIFPFQFLLPERISGTLYQQGKYEIKFVLRAELRHQRSYYKDQCYNRYLNIIEPCRNSRVPCSSQKLLQLQSYCMCISYGEVLLQLTCDKNFVKVGQDIQISGIINNTKGKSSIKFIEVVLNQYLIIHTQNRNQSQLLNRHELYFGKVKIEKGKTFNFTKKIQIPNNITKNTTAGKILGIFYTISMNINYGLCQKQQSVQLKIQIRSRKIKVQQNVKIVLPENWAPQIFQPIIYNKMRNFEENKKLELLNSTNYGTQPIFQEIYVSKTDKNIAQDYKKQIFQRQSVQTSNQLINQNIENQGNQKIDHQKDNQNGVKPLFHQ